MIVTEPYGTDLVKTYSDASYKIQQNGTGEIYDEAIDPQNAGRTYTETDIPIDKAEEDLDPERVLNILLGEEEE